MFPEGRTGCILRNNIIIVSN
uniref:Uncharacterized protein n=1 Tax=Anguilla anguilla TaxID=7936 RepID=A0A0E9V8K5_ANGAN